MPDSSRVVAGYAQLGGVVWDDVRQRLLFTADGALRALNPVTGQVTSIPIADAHHLGDLDISPDGQFALITEQDGRQTLDAQGNPIGFGTGVYYRVSLADGRVETLSFTLEAGESGYGTADVAVLPDRTALLALFGNGFTNTRKFQADAAAPVVTDLAQGNISEPQLYVSESHRYVLIAGGDLSSGPLAIYDATAGRITAQAALAQFPGHLGFDAFLTVAQISDRAGLAVIGDRDGQLVVTDLSLHLVKDLTFDFNIQAQGLQFSRDGSRLMVLQRGTNEIAVLDTRTWSVIGALHTQTPAPTEPLTHTGALSLSADGRFLGVLESTGVEVIDLAAQALGPPPTGLVKPRTVIFEPLRVPSGQTIDHPGLAYDLAGAQAGPVTLLSIAGTVTASGSFARGAFASAGGGDQLFLIESSGVVRVLATGPTSEANGYQVPLTSGPSFENRGRLEVSSGSRAFGVQSFALAGGYVNSGVVQVTAPDTAIGFRLLNLAGPSAFVNSGSITVYDAGGPFGTAYGVVVGQPNVTFLNKAGGSIVAAHDAPGTQPTIGVWITLAGARLDGQGSFVNAGLIQGETALSFRFGASAVAATFHNEATGVLRGGVVLDGDGVKLDNAGLIEGSVFLGRGNEVYDGSRGGRVTGTVYGGSGDGVMIGGPGADTFAGGSGNDRLSGGDGVDTAVYGAASVNYAWLRNTDGSWTVKDLRAGAPDGADTLTGIEVLQFADRSVSLASAALPAAVEAAFVNVTRATSATTANSALAGDIAAGLAAGTLVPASAVTEIVHAASATTSVATLAYEFFTGKAPSAGGMDFLVSPTGPNPNNLNSAYYQSFSLENRYINFAVNLGKVGEGYAAFTAKYGALSLFEATRMAYATIFGEAPSDAKLHAILDPTTVLNGQTFSRSDYFAYYGQDGANGIGTKAAMVGYLLAEAEKADLGVYAKSNDAFLTDVALHNAPFGVDLVGVYSQPGFVFHPG